MIDYSNQSPDQLVDLLADKTQRNAVIVALVGGITATELRRVQVSDAAKQALIADERYVPSLMDAARSDPTPKNRRHAIHAVTCDVCKPRRQRLQVDVRDALQAIAQSDVDASVRETALHELAEIMDES